MTAAQASPVAEETPTPGGRGVSPRQRRREPHGTVDITDAAPHRRAIAGLGRSFQEAQLYPSLTVAETIAVAFERHLPNRDTLAAALALPASTYM